MLPSSSQAKLHLEGLLINQLIDPAPSAGKTSAITARISRLQDTAAALGAAPKVQLHQTWPCAGMPSDCVWLREGTKQSKVAQSLAPMKHHLKCVGIGALHTPSISISAAFIQGLKSLLRDHTTNLVLQGWDWGSFRGGASSGWLALLAAVPQLATLTLLPRSLKEPVRWSNQHVILKNNGIWFVLHMSGSIEKILAADACYIAQCS